MPFIQHEKKNVFYVHEKTSSMESPKRAIIFVHGSGGSSTTWKYQLEGLNLNLNLIALDLPSHANSDPFEELSLELYVDVVKKLIEKLELEEVILLGHSLGGAIIQSFYFRYPNDVKGLILVGTGGRLRVSPMILDALANNYQKFLEELPSGAFYRKTPHDIIQEYIAETSRIPSSVTLVDFQICDAFDTLDKTETIYVPCLIICGKQDRLTPVNYSQYFHKKIKTSELVIINEAGHMVMLEKPKEFNTAVESFIKKYFS
ncbi:MAG: alpha/beta fold hydrolase [Promethearchaeota archaeon]